MLSLSLRAPVAAAPGRFGQASPFRLLVGLFLRRFLENDLVSPEGDARLSAGMALGLLAAPGAFSLVWLSLAYSGPFLTPSERLVMALDHKYQYIAASMILAALATAVAAWDSLSLDARDLSILGPLPIPTGRLLAAKAAALGVFVLVVAAAVNAIPALGFPLVWLSLVPIGPLHGAWLTLVHGLVSLAAAGTGVAVVVAVRSAVLLAVPPRLVHAAGNLAQFAVILALGTLFLLVPMLPADVPAALEQQSAALRFSPPMWLLGGYERLTARGLYADPRLTGEATWRFWQREQLRREQNLGPEVWAHPLPLFKTEAGARRRYEGMMPTLDGLAATGARAVPALGGLAAALYFLAHARHRRREAEALTVRLRRGRRRARTLWPLVTRAVAPHPLTRATFAFTLKALLRGGPQRLRLAAAVATGAALVAGVVILEAPARVSLPPAPGPAFLAPQYALLFVVLAAIRRAFATPAVLAARWIFQVTIDGRNARRPLAGVRRAMVAAGALPLAAAFGTIHLVQWGTGPALAHLAAVVLASLLLVEILLYGFDTVPFTSPGDVAGARLRPALYTAGLLAFAGGGSLGEILAQSGWTGAAVGAGSALAAVVALRLAPRRGPSPSRRLTFDAPADGVVTLGL